MKKSYRAIEPKGIEDYLRELCVIYLGEMDNPHDVNAIMDEERKIQILRYHLWDVERSILETPGSWRYLYLEEKGSLPVDDESIARKLNMDRGIDLEDRGLMTPAGRRAFEETKI